MEKDNGRMNVWERVGVYRDDEEYMIANLFGERERREVMKYFVLAGCWLYVLNFIWKSHFRTEGFAFYDVILYRHAAMGDFDYMRHVRHWTTGFQYPHWTAWFFGWMTWFSEIRCMQIMFWLLMYAYAILLVKLGRVNYGWIVAVFTVKPFAWTILSDNVAVILALGATTTVGAFFVPCVKLYLFPFALLQTYRRRVQDWIMEDCWRGRCLDLCRPVVPNHKSTHVEDIAGRTDVLRRHSVP